MQLLVKNLNIYSSILPLPPRKILKLTFFSFPDEPGEDVFRPDQADQPGRGEQHNGEEDEEGTEDEEERRKGEEEEG